MIRGRNLRLRILARSCLVGFLLFIKFLLLLDDLKHVLVQVTMTERRTFDVRVEIVYGQD